MTKFVAALVQKGLMAAMMIAALALSAERSSAAAPFTDITTSSGTKAVNDAAVATATPPATSWISGVSFVDLDGDGNLDLFLSDHHGFAGMGLNNGKGVFTFVPPIVPPSTTRIYPGSEVHCTYDINEDGKLDMSMTYGDGGGQWWVNNSTGPGVIAMTGQNANWGSARQQALVDINKDGKVDWLIGVERFGITMEYGNGAGVFTKGSKTIPMTGLPNIDGITPMPVDLTNSGSKDLVVEWGRYEYPNGRCRIYRNDGQGNFTDVTTAVGLYQDNLNVWGVGDYNQDGFTDLIAVENTQLPPSIFFNDGKGNFVKKAGAITGGPTNKLNYTGWGMTSMTDIDNDGIPDLIVGGRNFAYVYRGTGGGNFTYVSNTWGLSTSGEAAVDATYGFGDIDNDGKLEIAILPTSNIPILYHNDLPLQNWINVRPHGLVGNAGAAGAKIRIFQPGTTKLLWFEDVIIYCKQAQQNYYAYPSTERHYGLGTRATVDVEVEFYPSGKKVKHSAVTVDTVTGGKTEDISESETPAPPPPPPPASNPKFVTTTTAAGLQKLQDGLPAGSNVIGLHLVDLNTDDNLDLFVDVANNAVITALNDGKSVFTQTLSAWTRLPSDPGVPDGGLRLSADLNEDGKVDLLMGYQNGGSCWGRNQSTATALSFVSSGLVRPANTARNNVLVDLNKDGKIDWLRGATPGAAIDFGNGLGSFALNSQSLNNSSADDTSIFPIDLDNSGNVSLILQWGAGTGQSRIYRNTGNLTFSNVTAAAGLSENLAIKGVGDFNGDGFADLLTLEGGKTLNVYLNDGHGHFVKKANAVSGITGAFVTASKGLASAIDLDNDGLPDLLLSCPNRLIVLRGTGGGYFTAMNAAWAIKDQSLALGGLCFGDVDHDGMIDVVGFNATTAAPLHFDLYHNELAKKNYLNVRPVGLPGNKAASGAKIRLYIPGGALLASEQVALIGKDGSSNYYNYAPTERHFGLGVRTKVDVTVEFYPSGKVITQKNVLANTTLSVQETP